MIAWDGRGGTIPPMATRRVGRHPQSLTLRQRLLEALERRHRRAVLRRASRRPVVVHIDFPPVIDSQEVADELQRQLGRADRIRSEQ